MKCVVHPNQDGSFSVIKFSDIRFPNGFVEVTYRGKDAAREAYRYAIKMNKAEDAK